MEVRCGDEQKEFRGELQGEIFQRLESNIWGVQWISSQGHFQTLQPEALQVLGGVTEKVEECRRVEWPVVSEDDNFQSG